MIEPSDIMAVSFAVGEGYRNELRLLDDSVQEHMPGLCRHFEESEVGSKEWHEVVRRKPSFLLTMLVAFRHRWPYLMWIDADSEFRKPLPPIEESGSGLIWARRYRGSHPATGVVLVNTQHPNTEGFLDDWSRASLEEADDTRPEEVALAKTLRRAKVGLGELGPDIVGIKNEDPAIYQHVVTRNGFRS